MIVSKGIRLKKLFQWSFHHIVWLTVMMSTIAYFYRHEWISFSIPWLPVSVIGTAVAFYVGFKNNQAYDRMWEARKIWGAIVNSSRAWGSYVDGFVTNQFRETSVDEAELHQIKRRLIYRHIAWLYALRSQLLVVTEWEHANQSGSVGRYARKYQQRFGIGLVEDEVTKVELIEFLGTNDYERLVRHSNPATQIINEQSRDLRELRKDDLIDDFRHMELEQILYHFYEHQGKCERIKKFPFPRAQANMSRYFVGIFIAMLPFTMMPALMEHQNYAGWFSVPICVLIGWVYIMMEIVGDYSENPFQGMANDIPMLSLCRTIEIDLREMLGETDIPAPIEAKNDVLM